MQNFTIAYKNKKLVLDNTKIMGILNLTPDSFSDGGMFNNIDPALYHVEQMIKDGVDIIDIGGESTRPNAEDVSDDIQIDRIIPIIEAINKRFDTLISVDTSSPKVIQEASLHNIFMWNDVRALSYDGALDMAAKLDIPVCIMHMRGNPRTMQKLTHYDDIVNEVKDYLLDRANTCINHGIKKENIILDIGFGFAKDLEGNFTLLNNLEKLSNLGYPLLSALSRKGMLGKISHKDNAKDRVIESVSGALISALKGALIVRVHDVKETYEALSVLKACQNLGQ